MKHNKALSQALSELDDFLYDKRFELNNLQQHDRDQVLAIITLEMHDKIIELKRTDPKILEERWDKEAEKYIMGEEAMKI